MQNEVIIQPSTSKAESALELLKSLARAGDNPEEFAKACLDWTRLSDDATTLPEFQSIVAMLSGQGPETDARGSAARARDTTHALVFELDLNGTASHVSREVGDLMSLRDGDVIDLTLLPVSPEPTDAQSLIIEIPDRFGVHRKLKLWPHLGDNRKPGYTARVILHGFPAHIVTRLSDEFELTASEIEILELALRRFKLDQIAELRGIKLNTVRTHVSRLIHKLECHSLVEAITKVLELSLALEDETAPIEVYHEDIVAKPRQISLGGTDEMVEYRRYGSATGRPVLILHSLEYGYLPSRQMIETGRARNLNLIFPLRPGFGRSNPATTSRSGARILGEFLTTLDLSEVTVIGLSTAAPLALQISNASPRVGRTVLVNYGLNVADKLKAIQPDWIRGLLNMSLNSPASFAVGLAAVRSVIRSFGGLRFYRRLYRDQSADEAYLEANLETFEVMADYLLHGESRSVRHDIVSAFAPNREIESLLATCPDTRVINSADQHGVDTAASRAEADRLGVGFLETAFKGRNWMFQHPVEFFDIALQDEVAAI